MYSKILPCNNNVVYNLFKSYFSIDFFQYINKHKCKKQIKSKYNNSKRIYYSKPEIRHTNNKAIITLYTYNRKKDILIKKIMKKYKYLFKGYAFKKTKQIRFLIRYFYSLYNTYKKYRPLLNRVVLLYSGNNEIKSIYRFYLRLLKRQFIRYLNNMNINRRLFNYTKERYLQRRKRLSNKFLRKIKYVRYCITYISKKYINNANSSRSYAMQYNEKTLIALFFMFNLKKKRIFKYCKKILYYSKMWLIESKKTNNFLLDFKGFGLTSLLEEIYEKDVEIDIINHKYIYMNSDTFIDSIGLKLSNRKNKALRVLKKSIVNIKIPRLIDCIINYFENKDQKSFVKAEQSNARKNLLSSLINKSVVGVRLEASGRLTKRLTALRSVHKYRNIGSIKNINSSYIGIHSPVLRGNLRHNIQKSKLHGKTRNGAFGLKCWISSY